MRTRLRRHPVQRHHVLAMNAVLALGSGVITQPISVVDGHPLAGSAEPMLVGVLVASTFFMPALRLTCTQRGSWIALRRAKQSLCDFGLFVGLLSIGLFSAILANAISLSPHAADIAIGIGFDGLVDGAILYLWGWVALPLLHAIMRAETAWTRRGAR